MWRDLKFGTDGVRGVALTELTTEYAAALGRAAAQVLGGGRWLVGRDTRESGPELEAARRRRPGRRRRRAGVGRRAAHAGARLAGRAATAARRR